MKRVIYLLLLLSCCQGINAQNKAADASFNIEQLVVKDSIGTVYPAAIWQRLVSLGKYRLQVSADKKSGLITKIPDEEREKILAAMPKPQETKSFKTGEKITAFSEKDINGTRYDLKKLQGKVVVLNFWFVNCPPCRMEIPDLNEMVESYKANHDVVFIAVALDQKSDLLDFLKTNPYQYHIIDNGNYIASKYNVGLYPTHVVLNKEGKVVFHTSGLARNTVSWIKKSIDAALAETVIE